MIRPPLRTRRAVVAALAVLAVAAAVAVGGHAALAQSDGDAGADESDPFENATVVATSERMAGGDRANVLVAYAENGTELYRNGSHLVYNDVDPVPGTRATVEYVAAERLSARECGATTDCWENMYERANLSTGEVSRVYTFRTSTDRGQLHDMDRVGPTRLLVADIARDRAFVVDTDAGVVEWEWQAQTDFPFESGGPFPRDWTHINDVEMLDDGRVMASLRNQDQVVFVDPETGLQEDWTLGGEDDYDVLYEQHNPDYIPAAEGGPAVLVADSENDRAVEYHRDGDEWSRAWTWSDDTVAWPRDADRLPNGNTLITDTDGGRVLEVAPNGSVVWQVEIYGGYDAERLGTGDESAGGPATNATGE